MKILIKISIYFAFLLSFLFSFIYFNYSIKAAEEDTIKTFYLNDQQSVGGTLFSDDELLSPGDKIAKEFYIANDKEFKCFLKDILIDGKLYGSNKNILKEDEIAYKNYIKNSFITFYCEGKLIYSGNVQESLAFNLIGDDIIDIDKKSKKRFYIEYSLSENADKTVMGMQHKFNIDFNFSSVDPNGIDHSETTTIDKVVGGGHLVQTGSILDTKLLIVIGVLISVLGILLVTKKNANN